MKEWKLGPNVWSFIFQQRLLPQSWLHELVGTVGNWTDTVRGLRHIMGKGLLIQRTTMEKCSSGCWWYWEVQRWRLADLPAPVVFLPFRLEVPIACQSMPSSFLLLLSFISLLFGGLFVFELCGENNESVWKKTNCLWLLNPCLLPLSYSYFAQILIQLWYCIIHSILSIYRNSTDDISYKMHFVCVWGHVCVCFPGCVFAHAQCVCMRVYTAYC